MAHIYGNSKIGQLDIAIFSQQNIIWLDVSMHDMLRMQKSYGNCNLRDVKLNLSLWETRSVVQMRQQISTPHEVHDKENSVFVLKAEEHFDHKGVISFSENQSFVGDILYAIIVDEIVLS